MALFIFVPFAISLLMTLGYDKITALAATVGSILVGIIGSTYGTGVVFKSFMSMNPNQGVLYKVIFFAVVTTLYALFIVKRSKKVEAVVEEKPKRGRKKKDDTKALEKKEEVKKVDAKESALPTAAPVEPQVMLMHLFSLLLKSA